MPQEATVRGTIIEALPNTLFRVELETGSNIIAYLGGKLRLNRIRIIPGDQVSVVLSPDGQKGRIVYRN